EHARDREPEEQEMEVARHAIQPGAEGGPAGAARRPGVHLERRRGRGHAVSLLSAQGANACPAITPSWSNVESAAARSSSGSTSSAAAPAAASGHPAWSARRRAKLAWSRRRNPTTSP